MFRSLKVEAPGKLRNFETCETKTPPTSFQFVPGSARLGCPSLLRIALVGVLDDQRNSPVRWINGILRLAQKLVGKAAHLGNLFLSQPLLLHQAARGVRAIGGEFPVAIISFSAIRLGIRVTLDGNFVGQFAQFARQKVE